MDEYLKHTKYQEKYRSQANLHTIGEVCSLVLTTFFQLLVKRVFGIGVACTCQFPKILILMLLDYTRGHSDPKFTLLQVRFFSYDTPHLRFDVFQQEDTIKLTPFTVE